MKVQAGKFTGLYIHMHGIVEYVKSFLHDLFFTSRLFRDQKHLCKHNIHKTNQLHLVSFSWIIIYLWNWDQENKWLNGVDIINV